MPKLNHLDHQQLHLLDRLLDLAIDEDVGEGDATTKALFPSPGLASGFFVARQEGVMAGGEVLRRFYARLGARFADNASAVSIDLLRKDGEDFPPGCRLLGVYGDAGLLLTGERIALNILQRMCAIAGRTREFVRRTAGAKAKIYDTRKTTPGNRILDKLAVLAGGGENHRMGLYDMILVKDNHLSLYDGPAKAVRAARQQSSLPVMVEVDAIRQLEDILAAEPDYVLLDNMDAATLTKAVRLAEQSVLTKGLKRPLLEASGGIILDTVAAVAASGVDRISVGLLTSGAGTVDIGLDFS